MIFYGNIQIPRISGNFDACADSVYQALFPRKKGSLGSRLQHFLILLVSGADAGFQEGGSRTISAREKIDHAP